MYLEFTTQGGAFQIYLVTALLHINPKRIKESIIRNWTEELQLSAFLHGRAAAAFWLWRRFLSPLIPNRFEDPLSLHHFLLCASTLRSRHFLDMFECSLRLRQAAT